SFSFGSFEASYLFYISDTSAYTLDFLLIVIFSPSSLSPSLFFARFGPSRGFSRGVFWTETVLRQLP
ncbi:uncharacterized protein BO66DRAFT_372711, partial [Aspergillus aculeatinus CBS 121060]